MAITIDWPAKVINVPKADLTLIQSSPTEILELNLNDFRLELKSLEDDEQGITWLITHIHNPPLNVGGVVLARTVEIINDYTVTFEDGQYAVNLVGANSNVGDRVNVNQVSVRSFNSAGLQDLSTLLAAAYQGRVIIDPTNGQAGTATPIGTYATPVDNVPDAIQIAVINGLKDLVFTESMTLLEDLSAGYNLIGTSPYVTITADTGAVLTSVSMYNLTIEGELDGLNSLRFCSIQEVTKVSGFIDRCSLAATVEVTADSLIMQSYSNVEGTGYPVIAAGDTGAIIEVRDFHGSLGIQGVETGEHTVGVYGGRIVVESSCIGGTIYCRGDAYAIVDNSDTGCTVVDQRNDYKIRRGLDDNLALILAS